METTGENYKHDKIIQIGAVRFRNDQSVETFNQIVNPECTIIKEIRDMTGITQAMANSSLTIKEVIPKFLEFLGNDNVLVAHNAIFDMRFLLKNMYDFKYDKPNFIGIDTLEFADKYIKKTDGKKLASYKLSALKEFFELNNYRSHNALDDCFVTGVVYIKCKEAVFNKVRELYPKLEYLHNLNKRHRFLLKSLLKDLNFIIQEKI